MRFRALAGGVTLLCLVLLGAIRSAAQSPEPPPDPTAGFFNDDVIQEVRLTLKPVDWSALKVNFGSNTYYPCWLTWQGITLKNVGIRSRGNGSRSGTKPGLRVDIDHYAPGQRFLTVLKSFVLRNNTQDASNMHERLAMKLLGLMGFAAPRETFARLYVNDTFSGLYTIVEAIDKPFLTRTMGENDGYLYEYDYDAGDEPYHLEYRGSDPEMYSPKPFKPSTHEKDPDPKPLEAMIKIINETPDGDFQRKMADYMDLNMFMRYVGVENFLGETDGMLGDWAINNFYLYRLEHSTRSVLFPWDRSLSFAGGPEFSIWHNVDDIPVQSRNRLMNRAVTFLNLKDTYLDALLKAADIASTPVDTDAVVASARSGAAAKPPPPGWLETEIQREYQQIRAVAHSDTFKPYTNDEFEQAVEDLLTFARQRSTFVKDKVHEVRR
jgi:CotH kinase protein